MLSSRGRFAVVCFSVAVIALMVGASYSALVPAPLEEGTLSLPLTRIPVERANGTFKLPAYPDPLANASGPDPQTSSNLSVVNLPKISVLQRLADLEGKQNFTNVRPWFNYWNSLCYCDGAVAGATSLYSGLQVRTAPLPDAPPARDVEEADVVKLVGDRLYILNPYRGLMLFDLSDPDAPHLMGRCNIVGTPVDMYIVGDMAYVVVSANYGYWYSYSLRASDITVPEPVTSGERPEFYIGSEVLVVSLDDPSAPSVVSSFGLAGFITDSRRVGEVIYFVSSYHGWYDASSTMVDSTYIMSLNMADPTDVMAIDEVSFEGAANLINVTQSAIFVAHPSIGGSWTMDTTITYVDISDPAGDISVRGSFEFRGRVSDRYQMDCFRDTFRVVSHIDSSSAQGSSTLRIYDISDPDLIVLLGNLAVDDAGDLMATRFAGDRGYTIHLPRPIQSFMPHDPLDVMDLSDPAHPVMCDVLEIPGWVTHLEVRGNWIIALGLADLDGQQVAVSLFDVSDPWNAVLTSRVIIGEGSSWSGANIDPKSLTVLDDQGVVLVPFSAPSIGMDGNFRSINGVQVIKFDLVEGVLTLGGCFEQPDQVVRTRSLGTRVLSTSFRYLVVADVEDAFSPHVTATFDLCPEVLGLKTSGDLAAVILRKLDGGLALRLCPVSDLGNLNPLSEMDLDRNVTEWFLAGSRVHLLSSFYEMVPARYTYYLQVTTIDVSDPLAPVLVGSCTFGTGDYSYEGAITNNWWYSGYNYNTLYDMDRAYYWYGPSYYSQSSAAYVMCDRLLAVLVGGTVYTVDLSGPLGPRLASSLAIGTDYSSDVRAVGYCLYLTRYSCAIASDGQNSYMMTKYMLKRIDLSDPCSPLILPEVNIPGVPVGASSDGLILYTDSSWWLANDTTVRTLNVVALSERFATILYAIELDPAATVSVENGLAYITKIDWTGGGHYAQGSWAYEPYVYTSEVRAVSLSGHGRPVELGTMVLEGSYSRIIRAGSMALLIDSGSYNVLAVRGEEGAGVRIIGSYELNTYISSMCLSTHHAYIVQGSYGISDLLLA
jgi:hypothetical protein